MARGNTVAGYGDNGLPIRNVQGSEPPNGNNTDTVSYNRSDVEPGPSLEADGSVIDGPANGPDSITR
jgi:hypothetical protein